MKPTSRRNGIVTGKCPPFDAANRVNAYGTYLLMERESLQKK